MSVDYNELYQEFIQLTSSPSSTSSASSPPPDSSSLVTVSSHNSSHPSRFPPSTSETTPPTRKTVLTSLQRMNSSTIQDPQTPGTTTTPDHCISSPGGCPVSSSSSNNNNSGNNCTGNSLSSSSPVIMNQHAQYGWNPHNNNHHLHQQHQPQQQQQIQMQTAEKRKDLAGSIPAPPNSPSEPPAKKPALQGTDSVDSSSDRNNNSNSGGVHNHHEMHQDLSSDMKFPPVPSCIVNNIRATNQGNALSSMGYPEGRPDGDEGTNCVIIQKHPAPAPLNELRRLLSTPAANNQSNRHNPSQDYQQQPSHNLNHFMQDYGIEGNGEQQLAAAGWNHHQQMSDHHHHQQQHVANELQNHGQNGPAAATAAIYPQHSPLVPSQEVMDEVVRFMPYYASSNEQPTFPGGLEVLWKEVPEDCQRLITPQDVPETARFRGYFTVCELLTLKRSLMSRLTSVRNGQEPIMRKPPPSASAVAAAAANARADNIINTGMGTGVGGAVKEALAVLQDDNQPQHLHHHQQQQQQQQEQHHPMTTVSICNINHQSSPPSFIQNNNGMDESDVPLDHVNVGPKDFAITAPIMRPSNTPPPPYRTSTLVFKLLIIGNYRFRSFSHGNPNRLRVLFNTQRLSYECHLPMVPASNDSSQMLRKVLTIDVGFEQIAQLKFGPDQLLLRVNGPPVLNLSRNPAGPNEIPSTPPLSAEDHDLLEQIEKGSLKLGPMHSLYFINGRLVHQLENQFKEHPRLKHFFLHDQGRATNTTGLK